MDLLPGREQFLDARDLEQVAAIQRQQSAYVDGLVRPKAQRRTIIGTPRSDGDWRAKQVMNRDRSSAFIQPFVTPPPSHQITRGMPDAQSIGPQFDDARLTPRQARLLWLLADKGPMHISTLVSLAAIQPIAPAAGGQWGPITMGRPSDLARLGVDLVHDLRTLQAFGYATIHQPGYPLLPVRTAYAEVIDRLGADLRGDRFLGWPSAWKKTSGRRRKPEDQDLLDGWAACQLLTGATQLGLCYLAARFVAGVSPEQLVLADFPNAEPTPTTAQIFTELQGLDQPHLYRSAPLRFDRYRTAYLISRARWAYRAQLKERWTRLLDSPVHAHLMEELMLGLRMEVVLTEGRMGAVTALPESAAEWVLGLGMTDPHLTPDGLIVHRVGDRETAFMLELVMAGLYDDKDSDGGIRASVEPKLEAAYRRGGRTAPLHDGDGWIAISPTPNMLLLTTRHRSSKRDRVGSLLRIAASVRADIEARGELAADPPEISAAYIEDVMAYGLGTFIWRYEADETPGKLRVSQSRQWIAQEHDFSRVNLGRGRVELEAHVSVQVNGQKYGVILGVSQTGRSVARANEGMLGWIGTDDGESLVVIEPELDPKKFGKKRRKQANVMELNARKARARDMRARKAERRRRTA
jgi:hypothetical protein